MSARSTASTGMDHAQLHDHLVRNGHMTERGVTRRATARACQRCGAPVLVGLDDVICAFEVAVDPYPLNPIGELAALLAGRVTFALHREGGRFVIDIRDDSHIAGHRAGTRAREDVVVAHDCATGAPSPDARTSSTFAETTARRLPASAQPPF